MECNNSWIIRVMNKQGEFYDNAFVENDYDAILICQTYEKEGYIVKLYHDGRDVSHLFKHMQHGRVILPKGMTL